LPQYRIKADVVAQCLDQLRRQKIHNHFAGYLCVKRASARDKKRIELQVNFKETFESFLRVPDAPVDTPYVMPFRESQPSEANKWFNDNVAGSYAPSSLRKVSPLLKVVDVEGERRNARYSLKDDDAKLAFNHLLFKKKIPVACLAAFLYRDFAILSDNPTVNDLVTIFREEFGFPSSDKRLDSDFRTLFSFADSEFQEKADWFEVVQ
jgi:hypothetical protein